MNVVSPSKDAAPIIPATARGEATRRKLLDAAEREFGEKGFHAASVSSITVRAGVGQGTFYLYFRSKEEIFSTLVREIGHELRRRMAVAVTAATGLQSAAHAGVGGFIEFAQQHPGLFRIVQESQFVDEAAYREYYLHLVQGYGSGLRDAEKRGHVSPGDADVRAWAVIGIAHFLGLRYCLWEGRMPDAPVMDEVARFITRAMDVKLG
ncbi:MAG TPA: TetR/AcrR family transcriptional regulator [Solimonas sp.]|nr:TetR/AcrR family transcriptional regulator [Solimonas sp.]